MTGIKPVLLNGRWNYITDKDQKFTYQRILQLYLNKKTDGRIKVPSNWQKEGLNNFNGAVWYIREFNLSGSSSGLNILEFTGVDYFTDLWLNNMYIGSHEGYFQKFFFDITGTLNYHKKNLLVVKVTSLFEKPGTVWPLKKKQIKGIFNHHDCRPGGWSLKHGQDKNTGGIWNDVKLYNLSSVYIKEIKISSRLNRDYLKAKIKILLNFYINSSQSIRDNLSLEIVSPSGKKIKRKYSINLSGKSASLNLTIDIGNPELWWTWDLGKANLYLLSLNCKYFSVTEKFGIREVKSDRSEIFHLNGKKLFLRGTNVIPEQFLSNLTEDKIESQTDLIKDVNINIIRIHAHVNRKEYYDACDRKGILVWQDFALQWTYDDSYEFKLNAVRQIKDMVTLHYNHPSISFWCCHNEPGKQAESLDPVLYKAVLSIDKTRIVRLASNYEEHPYDGWYWGNKDHFAACPMGPVVTEFGAQALPELKSLKKFLSAAEINKPVWSKWKYHNFQYEQTFHIALVNRGKNIKEFIRNSQEYQSELINTAVDFYRREKFKKVNALFQFMLIDCWPSITWSLIDYYGKRKQGYFALKRAFQPLYVSIKKMKGIYFPGQKLNIKLWIINDLYLNYSKCKIDFILNNRKFGTIQLPRIEENSAKMYEWKDKEPHLPKNIAKGKHRIVILLKNRNNKVISINEFFIEIDRNREISYE